MGPAVQAGAVLRPVQPWMDLRQLVGLAGGQEAQLESLEYFLRYHAADTSTDGEGVPGLDQGGGLIGVQKFHSAQLPPRRTDRA